MVKILIVDESPFARARLRRLFEGGGHEIVGESENASQGLSLYKSLSPEIVTLAYLMTGKNGQDLLGEIIRHDPDAKVIMISGVTEDAVRERALQTGARAYLKKFGEKEDYLLAIDQVMEQN
jgi:two-component system chemotaxis response regulator CheY